MQNSPSKCLLKQIFYCSLSANYTRHHFLFFLCILFTVLPPPLLRHPPTSTPCSPPDLVPFRLFAASGNWRMHQKEDQIGLPDLKSISKSLQICFRHHTKAVSPPPKKIPHLPLPFPVHNPPHLADCKEGSIQATEMMPKITIKISSNTLHHLHPLGHPPRIRHRETEKEAERGRKSRENPHSRLLPARPEKEKGNGKEDRSGSEAKPGNKAGRKKGWK